MSQQIFSGLAFMPIAWDDGYNKKGEPVTTKAIVVPPMTFSASVNSFLVDLTQNNQMLSDERIQTIYIHNPLTSTLVVTISGTNFVLRIPAGYAYFGTIIAGDRPQITFSSTATSGTALAWILNSAVFGAYTYALGA